MLNIKKENISKSKVKISVILPPEFMVGIFKKVYDKLAGSVEVKGFRPGKAPKNLTIMQIGENRLISEIVDLAFQESYPQALKQEKLIPIAPPKINLKKMVDLTTDNAEIEYEAEIELLPEVKIGNYKNIRIQNSELRIKVSKEEIDQVMSHLLRQHATFNDIERSCKDGDRIEMDFVGYDKGVALEHLTSKNYPVILGSKVLIPDIEKNIIGMKKGEEKKFNVKLGKDKDVKNVDFEVKMNNVQEVILPKLDDSFAVKFQKKTIKELTDAVEKDIIEQKKLNEKQNQENRLVDELLKISDLEIPESLTEQESKRMVDQMKERTQMAGIPYEKYLESIKKTEEELIRDTKPQAERTVKIGLILGEIAKQEKIDLSKENSGKQVIDKLLENAIK